jgi:tRNA G10  N-methylase Trm11
MEHLPASLRPTVAAAMVRLAEIKSGHVVLDPMCGAGTILAETLEGTRQRGLRPQMVLGGDLDPAALRAAGSNLRRLGSVRLARWDARALPLPDRSVDCILCNPPFGKQLGAPEQIGPLYREALADWDRVLRPHRRAVLLASDQQAIKDAATAVGWKAERRLRVRILGQQAFISVWRKD